MQTVASLKRALTVGTKVRITHLAASINTNDKRNRDTEVTINGSTTFATLLNGEDCYCAWPKAAQYKDGVFLTPSGEPSWKIELI